MAASTAGFPLSSSRLSGRDDDGLRRQSQSSSVLPSTFWGGRQVVVVPLHSTRWLSPLLEPGRVVGWPTGLRNWPY